MKSIKMLKRFTLKEEKPSDKIAMSATAKLRNTLLLCIGALSLPAMASDDILWMNKWDQSCYEDGTNTCREDWYKIPQGTHLIKWEVFQNLEKENSRDLFSAQENLEKYGFLFSEENDYSSESGVYNGSYEEPVEYSVSQYGMPIGFVKDKNQLNNINYLGLTCATCHTGKVTYGDNTYFVEAGQGNLDFFKFLKDLSVALEATKSNPFKLGRFKRRFALYTAANVDLSAAPVDAFNGEGYLDEAIDYVVAYEARNQTSVINGPSRIDAIGAILNQVHIDHAGKDDANASPLSAPVSLPYIWDVSNLECMQTNCVADSPITRNAGEVLGVFGYSNIDEDENVDDMVELVAMKLGLNTLFNATPKMDNLFTLEQALSKASPPKWPSSFPPLNAGLMTQGKEVYAQNCGGCHMDISDGLDDSELTEANSIGHRFTKVTRVPYAEVGTDEAFAVDYGYRKETSGILGTIIAQAAPDEVDPETGIPFSESFPETFNALVLLGADTSVVLDNYQSSPEFAIKAIQAYPLLSPSAALEALKIDYSAGHVDLRTPTTDEYRAKPLSGIAFTGPFLHNGSVRTLKDLLDAPEDRPTSFLIGSTDYDVADGGYVNSGDFLLDTSIRGNSKDGHTYGTTLTNSEKSALLEYMKSL